MTVNRLVKNKNGLFFITFTCTNWLPLFEITNGYDLVYKWFDILRKDEHQIVSFVIMPNHVHAIIHFKNNEKGVDKWVSNGKRFMAYELVKRLVKINRTDILGQLKDHVTASDKQKGKIHQVFKDSFDIKTITEVDFLLQKLEYIHLNPVSKKWKLAKTASDYLHSSARFYESGNFDQSGITPYWEIEWLSLVGR